MTGYRVLAEVRLDRADEGGLAEPVPGGTQSLLLKFPGRAAAVTDGADGADGARGADEVRDVVEAGGAGGGVTLEAILNPGRATAVVPGQSMDIDMLLWADDAPLHAVPGAVFDLWYGRPVGRGVVTDRNGELAG